MLKQQTNRQVEDISRLEQVSGGGKGQTFELYKDRMAIGRSEECDIILPHESVSRVHAFIEKNGDLGFLVFDNDSKNGVYLNGSRVEASPLRNGDSIQIGLFGFKYFGKEEVAQSPGLQVVPEKPQNNSLIAKLFQKKTPAISGSSGGGNKRLLLYGAVGILLAVVVLYKPDETKPVEPQTAADKLEKTEAKFSEKPKIDEVVKGKGLDPAFDDPLEASTKVLSNPDLKDSNIITAEQYFKSGLREYSNKNFQRAIDNFKSALTLSSKHPLAKYYLDLAIFESENAAKQNRDLAIQYYRTMNYDRAIYYCKEVIAYLQHNPTHPSLKTCKEFIENAKQINQAAELAP